MCGEKEMEKIEHDLEKDDVIYWEGILFLMGKDEVIQTERLWKEYENEIKYRSRFFPKSKLLDKIKECADYATNIIKKGTVLYRARKYNSEQQYGYEEIQELYEELKRLFPEENLKIEDLFVESKFDLINLRLNSDKDKFEKFEKKKEEIFGRKKSYWGFDAEGSDAPQKEKASGGRANSPNISYLYTAENIETALLEVQPKTQQAVSVAEILITEDTKIFDFCTCSDQVDEYLKSLNLETIAKKFSAPNYGDPTDYYPTQFLCEYIRELGFKGIRFPSSLKRDGINIVLFDTEKNSDKTYKVKNSCVYVINEVNLQYNKILPVSYRVAEFPQ